VKKPVARTPFEPEMPRTSARLLPYGTVMLGSLVTIIPVVAKLPLLPPFGLLMLLGWRLLRNDVFRIWAPLPLGFFDDLVSGQPLGSAMLLWMVTFFVIDAIEQRMVWRDSWQNWLIASGGIALCLAGGRLVATPLGAHVDSVLLVQILVSILLFPLAARLCAALDRRRDRAQ
jgi:rod shape-determining protein MreD